MMRGSSIRLAQALFLSLLIFATCGVPSFAQTPNGQGKILAGYFEEWGTSADYSVANLEKNGVAAKLTHIIYAFGNVVDTPSIECAIADPKAAYLNTGVPSVSGAPYTVPPYGNFGALIQLKQLHPNLKVLISLGGAAAGNVAFSVAASTQAGRQALVASCINIFIKGNVGTDSAGNPISTGSLFDGVNVDWEYPASADKHNYTLLLQEFREQLNMLEQADHRHYLLTIDSPTKPENYSNVELAKVAEQLDFLTLDGYDFASPSDSTTNHASALYDSRSNPAFGKGLYVDSAISVYLKAGVPGRKLVLGLPLYGQGWMGVPGINHGLYQSSTGPAPSPAGDALATDGVATYKTLSALSGSGYTRYFDPQRIAVWFYNPATHTFWSYDDPFTILLKMIYVSKRTPGGLGGAFVWALRDDDENGDLVKAIDWLIKPDAMDAVSRLVGNSYQPW
ncbi:MAG: glycoside hydrolase family 18 protein [Candidatus Kryptoniota bacterium]